MPNPGVFDRRVSQPDTDTVQTLVSACRWARARAVRDFVPILLRHYFHFLLSWWSTEGSVLAKIIVAHSFQSRPLSRVLRSSDVRDHFITPDVFFQYVASNFQFLSGRTTHELPSKAVEAVVMQQRTSVQVNTKWKAFERSYRVESPRLHPEFSLEIESHSPRKEPYTPSVIGHV